MRCHTCPEYALVRLKLYAHLVSHAQSDTTSADPHKTGGTRSHHSDTGAAHEAHICESFSRKIHPDNRCNGRVCTGFKMRQ